MGAEEKTIEYLPMGVLVERVIVFQPMGVLELLVELLDRPMKFIDIRMIKG